jgi:hypothetical protein
MGSHWGDITYLPWVAEGDAIKRQVLRWCDKAKSNENWRDVRIVSTTLVRKYLAIFEAEKLQIPKHRAGRWALLKKSKAGIDVDSANRTHVLVSWPRCTYLLSKTNRN